MPVKQYFPLQDPVDSEDVVDRAAFLDELGQRLGGGERLLLSGPRRTGKTSLALEALRRLKASGHYTAYVDLFGVESRGDFAELLVDALFENRSRLQRTVRAMRSLASGVAAAANGLDLKFPGFDLAFSLAKKSDDALFEESLDLAQRIAAEDDRRVIVVLDEFQDFGKLGGEAVFKKLRAHFQRHAYVSYLFLGSQAGVMRELFGRGRQAFYRFAVPLDVPPVPEAAWVSYMDGKFRSRGLLPTDLALRDIVSRTGGHPSDTMWVCQEIWHSAQEIGTSTLSVELVEVGYERALQHLQLAFDEIWNGFTGHKGLQPLVSRIANGEQAYPKGEHPQTVTRALHELLGTGVATRLGRGTYRLTEPMLAEYVRRRTGR